MENLFHLNSLGIDNTGSKIVTEVFQKAIDYCAENKLTLIVDKGRYLVSALYFKSDLNVVLDEDSEIIGTSDEKEYEDIYSRVAGIMLMWYPAIINIIDCCNVKISGLGKIIGQGPYFYKKYWDMRKQYDKLDLRFACDYDCKRVRNVLVMNSKNICLSDFTSKDSGFWNVHILFSSNVFIDNLNIDNKDKNGASTDGIDIDSCNDVYIKNCILNTYDDSICIKSGRDEDGRRINRPCEKVFISNCKIMQGFGITIGSELSGGIKDINISDIEFDGTDCGFRIKSTPTRGGFIDGVTFKNIKMKNVKYCFRFDMGWNPLYNKKVIINDDAPSYYHLLVCEDKGKRTKITNIDVSYLDADYDENYEGICRAFHIKGFEEQHINGLNFYNVHIRAKEYGIIENVDNLTFKESKIIETMSYNKANDEYDNR